MYLPLDEDVLLVVDPMNIKFQRRYLYEGYLSRYLFPYGAFYIGKIGTS